MGDVRTVPVVVELTYKLVVDVVISEEEERERGFKDVVEFWLNESAHCANNELRKLCEQLEAHGQCACSAHVAKFVRVATELDLEYLRPGHLKGE